ncbi:MAG TPA: protein kinase [Gemmataceae bacterium]|nr:protein kinase [Gemmataceae bacterium]
MPREPDQRPGNAQESAHQPQQSLDALLTRQRGEWLAGVRTPAEEWLRQHPALTDSACAVEVIYHEYLLRQELDEQADWEDYLRRFPQFAATLQDLREADQLVDQVFAPAGPPLRDSRRFGNYELLEKIGQGGMGVVYKARQHGLDRVVALKMLRGGEYAEEQERRCFLGEARAVALLQHPNIVPIYDVGEVNGLPFCSLEYVEGRSLADCLNGTPWEPRSAASLVETLARAVAHAHGRAIVHRDLKPANVLLAGAAMTPPARCAPKIADFGLAKRLDATSQSRSGHVVGTPSYMAPEAAEPRLGTIGPATDVYGLGAVLYELLTGRPPFRADSLLETFRQVVQEEPAPPRVLNPAVPRDLETICLKCLHKEPAGRYASAEALADDLRRFIHGEPVAARPVGRVSRLWRWSRRNPALAGALTAVILAVAAGLSGVLYEWHRAGIEWHRAELARRAAESSDAEAFEIFSELTQTNPGWPFDDFAGNLEVHRLGEVTPYGPNPYGQLGVGEIERTLKPLEKADAHGARLLQKEPGNLAVRRALTSVRISRGVLNRYRGQMDRAAKCFSSAGDLWAPLVRGDPANREYRDWLATTELWSGRTHVGDFARTLEAVEDAQGLWQELADEDPTNPGLVSRLAYCRRIILESIPGCTSGASQALPSLAAYRARLERKLRVQPDNVQLRRQLAFTCLVLATIYDHESSASQASSLWEQACKHYRWLAGRSQVDVMTKFNLASCCARLMHPTASDPNYLEATRLFTEVDAFLGKRASAIAHDVRLEELQRQTREGLALCCWKAGNAAEADQWVLRLTETVAERGRAVSSQGRPSLEWIKELTSAAAAFRSTRPSTALTLTQQAATVAHQYDAVGISDRQFRQQLGIIFAQVANLEYQLGLPTQSLHSAECARRILEGLCREVPAMPAYRSELHDVWVRIAKAHWVQGRFDEALACFRQSVADQRQALELVPHSPRDRLILDRAYEQLAYYSSQRRAWLPAVDAHLDRAKLWSADPGRRLVVAKDLAELARTISQQPNLSAAERAQQQRCVNESQRIRLAIDSRRAGFAGTSFRAGETSVRTDSSAPP